MKLQAAKLLVATMALTALTGCYVVPLSVATDTQAHAPKTKMTAIGHGAYGSYDRYTDGQKKLMAMRASKLDAYRALAELVYGVRVAGTSTVGAMAIQNDNFRVSIDAYVRGARVTSVIQTADGNYETTVEMDYDDSVVQTFLLPVQTQVIAVPGNASPYAVRAGVGAGATYGSNYYYAE